MKKRFQKKIKDYYKKHKRELPFRDIDDPYKVLVSEIMLQQTQVDRVVPKYTSFIRRFPTIKKLAEAPIRDVLKEWQGLGYNRRAKMLHELAREIRSNFKGRFPKSVQELEKLPGIGPYTARAVSTFAFNRPEVFIETNIRTVFIHEFFARRKTVEDKEIIPFIEETLDRKNPRNWYYALMDYGTYLKKIHPNPSRRSKHHAKQSRFEGSDRQKRGQILRLLLEKGAMTDSLIAKTLKYKKSELAPILDKMKGEGIVIEKKGRFGV